jgi:predicted nucleic acid-binding protein
LTHTGPRHDRGWCNPAQVAACRKEAGAMLAAARERPVARLVGLLSRLDLRSVDPVTAEVATSLAGAHRLRAADAVHLATAVVAGADRFLTNNRRDFPETISEIDVTYPEALDER